MGDTATYLVPVAVVNMLPLITLPIFTRALTPADYGKIALATAFGMTTTGLANFGMGICYERNFFEYREPTQAAQLLYSVLAFILTSFLSLVFLTWLFQDAIAGFLSNEAALAPMLVWGVMATGMTSAKQYYLMYLRNSGDAKRYVAFTISESILAATCSMLFVVGLHGGAIGMLRGQFVAALLVFLAATVRFVRRLPVRLSFSMFWRNLKLSLPLTPRILTNIVGNNFDKYLLGMLATLGGLGVYSIGQKLSYVAFTFMNALENVFAPQVYNRMFSMGEEGGRSVGRYLTPFVYASTGAAFLLILFAEEALTVLTPTAFHDAIPVVNLLVIYYAVMFFGKQPQLLFAKKTYLVSLLTVSSISINLAANVIGIRLFGILGAAGGTLLAGCTSVVIHNLVSRRYYRIEWEYRKLAAILGLLVAASVFTVMLREQGVPYPVRLAVKLGLGLGYIGIGIWISVVTRENLALARNLVLRKLGLMPPVAEA